MCRKAGYKCQKQVKFTPKEFPLESSRYTNRLAKIFKDTQSACKNFLKSEVNVAASFIGMAFRTELQNPALGQATKTFFESFYEVKF